MGIVREEKIKLTQYVNNRYKAHSEAYVTDNNIYNLEESKITR
jgi:hypothetical protein